MSNDLTGRPANAVVSRWEDITIEQLNQLLRPHGVRLRARFNRRLFAEKALITAEPLSTKEKANGSAE